ncbi:MAG: component of SufBCD complex [Rhodobacteraceae bacterium]|nr:component of SufBCD complex [Paracoccaceae bacterium]
MTTIFQFIDLRSFSDVWYWLMLGVVWTRVMHAPMGVPAELIHRARRGSPEAADDLARLTAIRVRHERDVARALGAWRVAFWSCALTACGLAAYLYFVEFAQAVFLLLAPYALVRLLVARTAARMDAAMPSDDALVRAHLRLRRQVQVVVLPAVFLSAVWGMGYNLAQHAL